MNVDIFPLQLGIDQCYLVRDAVLILIDLI